MHQPLAWRRTIAVTVVIGWAVTLLTASAAPARFLLSEWAPNLDLVEGIEIPAEIAVPAGNKLQSVIRAEGHQHYRFNGTDWVLTNATAKLYNAAESSDVVGRHFFLPEPDAQGGQPTWRVDGEGGSEVTARTVVAVRVDSEAITWNLLIATSHRGDPKGPLAQVTYVHRIKTRRGRAPSTTEGVETGAIHNTKYYSLYAFYVKSS